MSRFLCICGYQIRTSGDVPNPLEWHLLSDQDFDAFHGLVKAEDVYRATTIAYRCPDSGHLWVFWNGLDAEPVHPDTAHLRGVTVN
jgi:hypothetical protein